MRIHRHLSPERGSVTLVTLCMSTVMAIVLGSYLALCHSSYDASTRLFHADQARELSQIGLEEAIWALNQNDWSSSGPESNKAWTTSGANRSVTLDYPALSPGASGQVTLTVSNYASSGPTWPGISVAAKVTLADGTTSTKTIQASTRPVPLFGNAIASANSYVSFVTGGSVDSWNSDPDNNSSTAAVAYSFSSGNASNYAAVIAGQDNGTYGVVLNQAAVNGYVATSGKPISYSTSGSPNGMVRGPSTGASVKVDPTRVGQSAFVPASSVFTVGQPATSGAAYGGLIGNILDLVTTLLGAPSTVEVYRVNGDLTIAGIPLLSPSLTVDNRNLKLIIDGNLTLAGAGKITVNSNASLQIFVAGDVTIGGSGFDNKTNDPRKLAIFATSTSTSDTITYTTSADFNGVIYSENKPIDIRQNAEFFGALLSGQYVRFSTSATAPVFHYDTSLRTARFSHVTTPYLVDQVSEP